MDYLLYFTAYILDYGGVVTLIKVISRRYLLLSLILRLELILSLNFHRTGHVEHILKVFIREEGCLNICNYINIAS